jgi:hypothetical protein
LRIISCAIVLLSAAACVSTQSAGPVGEGYQLQPTITAVDSSFPPIFATVNLDRAGSAALLLVVPGHSATVLYPPDSTTSNSLTAGQHQIAFRVPDPLLETDSMRLAAMRARDTTRGSMRPRAGGPRRTLAPIDPNTPTFLLLVTSPQPLAYQRLVEKTQGVSIPNVDTEALNAVGKAIKSTIQQEPREWAGFFRLIALRPPR